MDLISAAERLAAIDHSMVAYYPNRCLLAIDKFSTCERCVDLCPVQAVRPGSPPEFDSKTCLHCLACLPTCPGGAFSADDELSSVLTCLARVNRGPVEILCAKNPHTDLGFSPDATAICIDSCLAGIGMSGYLAMAGIGVEPVMLRTEACPECPLSQLAVTIERQISLANQILELLEQPLLMQTSTAEDLNTVPNRHVWDAHNPPLTRRDLFRMVATSGKVALARSLALDNQTGKRQPSLEHRRAVMAIKHLSGDTTDHSGRLHDLPFASLQATPACTACGACVRSCPNGALEMIQDEDRMLFQLIVTPAECNGCEICLHVCGMQALEIDHAPQFREIFSSPEAKLLRQGELRRCQRCSQLFASATDCRLCPVCEFRRNNPFSVRLPSHLMPG